MNSTNTNQSGVNSCRATGFWAGVILLLIGLIVGVFGSKHYWQKSAFTAMNTGDKQTAVASGIKVQPAVDTGPLAQAQAWDPIQQMGRMQAEIDQIFQRSFADFRQNAGITVATTKPGYSLSMDVRDLKNKYQVRAFLPDTKPSDVKVNLTGDDLKVDVANKTSEKPTVKNGETAMTEWGNYEEIVRLAGPLKAAQMTVQHLPHELVISVPKA